MIRTGGPERSRKIEGPGWRTETGDSTGVGTEALEEEVEGFLAEGAVEAFPVVVGEEDFPVEVEDVVVADLKTEADIRREGKIGDVEPVASTTIPTDWNVTSARTLSQTSHRPTPWRTPGTRLSG